MAGKLIQVQKSCPKKFWLGKTRIRPENIWAELRRFMMTEFGEKTWKSQNLEETWKSQIFEEMHESTCYPLVQCPNVMFF